MVLANSHRITPVPRYSGYRTLISNYVYKAFTLYGLTFQIIPLIQHKLKAVLNPKR